MYGLSDNFSLTSVRDTTLIQVQIGHYQVQLGFDGNDRSVSIESRYIVVAPRGEAEELTDAPVGAAALAALLGAHLEDYRGRNARLRSSGWEKALQALTISFD